MTEPGTDLIRLPDGQLVDLTDMNQCAQALQDIRDLASFLTEAKGAIVDAVANHVVLRGDGKTIHLDNGMKLALTGGQQTLWDAQQLEAELREAGMPEDRIREIVVEEVSWTVRAAEANKAARVNDAYRVAVERARQVTEQRPSVTISRA
jgi:hypothetical protein